MTGVSTWGIVAAAACLAAGFTGSALCLPPIGPLAGTRFARWMPLASAVLTLSAAAFLFAAAYP